MKLNTAPVRTTVLLVAMMGGLFLAGSGLATVDCTPRDDEIGQQDLLGTVPDPNGPGKIIPGDASVPRYYVAMNGDDRWSGRFPDPGRSDGPFATLARARDAVRSDAAYTAIKAAIIYIRGGRYRLAAPVVFTSQDAGIRIAAFGREYVELSGANSIAVSPVHPRGRLEAKLSDDPGAEIFVGPSRQFLAAKTEEWRPAVAEPQGNAFSYRPGDIDPQDVGLDTKIELFDVGRSATSLTRIVSLDRSKHVATVAPSDQPQTLVIGRFRLIGRPSWISRRGQFAWDVHSRRLVMDPTNAREALRFGVDIPVSSTVMIFREASGNAVVGMHFIDTRTALPGQTESAAILLEHSHNVMIADNEFRNVGQAIRLIGSSDNWVLHNAVVDTGSYGIEIQDGSDRNLVAQNAMAGIGQIAKSAAAIYLHGANANRIAYNVINGVSRHGIGIDNWDDQTLNVANVVEYNKLRATNRETADTGAIEMLGRSRVQTASIIRFNDIRDAAGSSIKTASGIYLDDLTSGVLICGNLLAGAPLAAIHIHGGSHISVRDNVISLDRANAVFIFFQGAKPVSNGHRFDFTWNAGTADAKPHRLEIRFDNDAVIGQEDRDLFIGEALVGDRALSPDDPSAQYVIDDGRVLPGQTAMPWNGTLRWELTADLELSANGHQVPISVFAWANEAAGVGAHFLVSMDGAVLGGAIARAPPDEMPAINVTRNIVYATRAGTTYFKSLQGGKPVIARNDYFDLTGSRRLGRSAVEDSAPIVSAPHFRDSARGDYRLNPSSSLKYAGFGDIPICSPVASNCPDPATTKETRR